MRLSRSEILPAFWLALFVGTYAPLVGRGLLLDDFAWIAHSRVASIADAIRLFHAPDGFYRPLVSLTFAANWSAFGLAPFGYGLTNLLLSIGCAVAIRALAVSVRLGRLAAFGAAALWAFNLSGINMALLWVSGRTSLLATLFATTAAVAALRQRPWLASVSLFAALLSKEEALPAPLLIIAALWILRPEVLSDPKQRRSWALALSVPVATYFVLRGTSDAFLPQTAPEFYRYTFDVRLLATNVFEYAHRAAGFGLFVVVSTWLVTWRRPALSGTQRRVMLFGVVWTVAGFIVTLALPVRSSLYVCLPSAGVALAAAAVLESMIEQANQRRRMVLAWGAILLPMALVPVYVARAQRWVEPARLSRDLVSVLRTLQCPPVPPDYVLLVDDPAGRANLSNAFGALLPEAIQLATGRPTPWRTEPPLAQATPDPRATGRPIVTIATFKGRVTSVSEDCPAATRVPPATTRDSSETLPR